MATMNKTAVGVSKKTHEGSPAFNISAEKELRRTVLACMLWEDSFYESGVSVADRISKLVGNVPANKVLEIAVEARNKQYLRHAPLYLIAELERTYKNHNAKQMVADTLFNVVQRPDELGEFIALYWRGKKQNEKKTPPLTAQAKKGLARAFAKFDAYQLAKYNNTEKAYKLKDVFRLVHPTTEDKTKWVTWVKLLNGQLESPDTWEVALSAGADKKETFTRLIQERKLGTMALLRNLRNMQQAGVADSVIMEALASAKADKVLPFRFISAAKYAPKFESNLEALMFKCLQNVTRLPGKTVLLIDVSGSMAGQVSAKSDISRLDAASGVAMLLREICDQAVVYRFDDKCELVPSRRGFALRDAIGGPRGGTYTGPAIQRCNQEGYDRLIVITDEQSHTTIPGPLDGKRGYFVNVAPYQNGIGYGKWVHIDGWSDSIVSYITEYEKSNF